jgi:hypothetical protein
MNNKSLTESVSVPQKRYLLEDTFAELNRLYEEDEQQTAGAAAQSTGATVIEKPAEEQKTGSSGEAKEILDKLAATDNNFVRFVSILMKDGKSKAFLDYLNKHYIVGHDSLQTVRAANAQEAVISCAKLLPTLKHLSLRKSLRMIDKPGLAVNIINTPTEAFNDPTVIYAGKYIIDGHHRWSKAYALNGKDCKIKVLNFPEIAGVDWLDMLKAVQLAIVATKPDAKLFNQVDDDNMLADDGTAAEAFYVKKACDEVVQAMKAKGRGETKEEQGKFVHENVANMKSINEPVSGAKPRAVMPQIPDEDKGGAKAKALLKKAVIDLTNNE